MIRYSCRIAKAAQKLQLISSLKSPLNKYKIDKTYISFLSFLIQILYTYTYYYCSNSYTMPSCKKGNLLFTIYWLFPFLF